MDTQTDYHMSDYNCKSCVAIYDKEEAKQKRIAKDMRWDMDDEKLEMWRFHNRRPRLERQFLRCDTCEQRKNQEQFEYQNDLDGLRSVFLNRLQANDTEALTYMNFMRKEFQELGFHPNNIYAMNTYLELCPSMYKTIQKIKRWENSEYLVARTIAHLVMSLVELEA